MKSLIWPDKLTFLPLLVRGWMPFLPSANLLFSSVAESTTSGSDWDNTEVSDENGIGAWAFTGSDENKDDTLSSEAELHSFNSFNSNSSYGKVSSNSKNWCLILCLQFYAMSS